MKDDIYEKDYFAEHKKERENSIAESNIIKMAIESGVFASISKRMSALPHVVDPEKQKAYQICLQLLDTMARELGGKIKGVISYQKFDAQIELTVPFLEFSGKSNLKILQFLASQARDIHIYNEKNGQMKLTVYIDYFESLGNYDKIFYEEMNKHPEVVDSMVKLYEQQSNPNEPQK